jgi:hypothetical protein
LLDETPVCPDIVRAGLAQMLGNKEKGQVENDLAFRLKQSEGGSLF